MDRATVQGHIASALAKYGKTAGTLLIEFEVDRAESGSIGMIGFRKGSKRVAIRVGKFIRQFFGAEMDDQTIQNIGADITALLWSGDNGKDGDSNGVKELEGEALRGFYLEGVSGISSCMAHEDTQDFLDIYADNPDVVKLATVRMGEYAARALVWTFPDGRRYMDRIYHTSEACHAALKQYRDSKGIESRNSIPSDSVTMKIRNGKDSYWPYLDTLCYMNLESYRKCTLSTCGGDYFLQTTDGTAEHTGERCHNCWDRIDQDDAYHGPDDELYCEDCYSDLFASCDHCGNTVSTDDLVSTQDGRGICEACSNHHFFECHECRGICADNDGHDVDGDHTVCEDCYERYYFECDDCGDSVHVDEEFKGPGDTRVCRECAEQYDECAECGGAFEKDCLVDGMCADCATDKMVKVTTTEEVNHA